jgi:hypothetical protein
VLFRACRRGGICRNRLFLCVGFLRSLLSIHGWLAGGCRYTSKASLCTWSAQEKRFYTWLLLLLLKISIYWASDRGRSTRHTLHLLLLLSRKCSLLMKIGKTQFFRRKKKKTTKKKNKRKENNAQQMLQQQQQQQQEADNNFEATKRKHFLHTFHIDRRRVSEWVSEWVGDQIFFPVFRCTDFKQDKRAGALLFGALELMIIVLLLLLLLSIWVANFGDSWCHRWNSWERCGLESIYILVALLQVSIVIERDTSVCGQVCDELLFEI